MTLGTSKNRPKAWKGRGWGKRYIGYKRFLKLPCIPGNQEGQEHDQSQTDPQNRPEKTLSSHLWLNFRVPKTGSQG